MRQENSSLGKAWKIIRTIAIVSLRKLALLFKGRNINSLVIIKIDAIGDYVLFRNFLRDLRSSHRYKGYRITLIGNDLWRDLFNELDRDIVDRMIWIDHKKYSASFDDRRDFLLQVTDTKYSDLIVFHYSRSFITELLAFSISAKNKIGINGDRSHLRYNFTDRVYSKLVDIPGRYVHEFSKYSYFTAAILGSDVLRDVPSLELISVRKIVDADTIVIAPGAGATQRQLPVHRWEQIVTMLLGKGYKVCLIGGKAEQLLVEKLISKIDINPNLTDLTGKSTLADLPHIISNCRMLICNETSTYHFAVALKKMVVCFAGGGHFKRFALYNESPLVKLVYHQMDCFNCNWYCIYPEQAQVTYPCISSIDEDKILTTVESALEGVRKS